MFASTTNTTTTVCTTCLVMHVLFICICICISLSLSLLLPLSLSFPTLPPSPFVYLLASTAWCTVPARLVVCDMMVGSVERIIGSSWLLGVLDQLRVLSLVVQRRQLSYNVTTQVRFILFIVRCSCKTCSTNLPKHKLITMQHDKVVLWEGRLRNTERILECCTGT